jgi:glycosyltransferase involved in cell wall biosynthesis
MSKSAHMATKNLKVPFTLDLHENYPAAIMSYKYSTKFPNRLIVRPKHWKKLEKSYLSYPKNIVVLSDTFKNYLLKKYDFLNENQFTIYPNVPDLKQFSEYNIYENIIEKEKNIILFYFGGIGKRRGIVTCLEAMKKLSKTNPQIKLLLIGPIDKHEQEFFQDYFGKEEIKNNIIYYPWKDIKYLPSYIKASDICLSPIVKNSQHESGVANKIFQYMLFEKPLIVSDCKPQEKIINDENCGVVFRSEDVDDLVEKTEYLIANRELCREMGKNGKKAVLEKYNLENFGKELAKIYE